ncbi:MAG: R3H domain-containing nucleic acid-binding protein [Verrucomicrobiota bacterium]
MADYVASARDILRETLDRLGFGELEIQEENAFGQPALQVTGKGAEALVGPEGDRLDDLQYLVNRLLSERLPDSPKIRVDAARHRTQQDEALLAGVKEAVEQVRASGKPVQLPPMNSYHRRIVHNALLKDKTILTWSPPEKQRMKQITLMPARKK